MACSFVAAALSIVSSPTPLAPRDDVCMRLATDMMWNVACGGATELELGQDVEVRASPGRGDGVFAKRRIPAGTLVTRYTGALRRQDAQFEIAKAGLTTGVYTMNLDEWVVDAEPPLSGYARFINHSVGKQNLTPLDVDLPDELRWLPLPSPFARWFEASCDIEAGEELLYDYGEDYWDRLMPLFGSLQRVLPEESLLWRLNARLNPRRLQVDYF